MSLVIQKRLKNSDLNSSARLYASQHLVYKKSSVRRLSLVIAKANLYQAPLSRIQANKLKKVCRYRPAHSIEAKQLWRVCGQYSESVERKYG